MNRLKKIILYILGLILVIATFYILKQKGATLTANEENTDTTNSNDINLEFLQELIYEDDELLITVTAIDEKAIPLGATLEIKKLNNQDDEYEKVVTELFKNAEEKQKLIVGFYAYDISLINSEGEEIEPDGFVNVSIEYKQSNKSGKLIVDDGISINVEHFKENDNGDTTVVDLAENNQLKQVEIDDNKELEMVCFETESFSTFTITYDGKIEVTVHYVDDDGNELIASHNNEVGTTRRKELIEYMKPIEGYVYVRGRYETYMGKVITAIQGENGEDPISIVPGNSVKYTVKFYNGDNIVAMIEEEQNARKINIYLVYTSTDSIDVIDTIADDGCIKALSVVQNQPTVQPASEEIKYVWYKSTTDSNYQVVERIKVTGDEYNIKDKDGPVLNVAIDEGSFMWYKCEKHVNGNLHSADTYHIPYHSQVLNGSFENPINPVPDTKLNGGGEDIVWKSTASDGKIEIAKTNEGLKGGGIGATVSTDNRNDNMKIYHFAYTPDGNQAAELNANESGALYQDILSVPGSQLYWSLYHRARGKPYTNETSYQNGYNYTGKELPYTDTMYVIAMSTNAATKYDVVNQEKVNEVLKISKRAKEKLESGVEFNNLEEAERDLYDAEIVKITTTNNSTGTMEFSNGTKVNVNGTIFGTDGYVSGTNPSQKYVATTWHYYTGNFSIPSGQYLTRYFFVAGDTQYDKDYANVRKKDPLYTVGNLIDNISVSDVMPEPNEGQAQIIVQKNIVGLSEKNITNNYSVPLELSFSTYNHNGELENTFNKNPDTEELRYDYLENGDIYRYYRHSYPVTIPANGSAKLDKFIEKESGGDYNYEIPGYKMTTHLLITNSNANRDSQPIVLFDGDITNPINEAGDKGFLDHSQLTNHDKEIEEKDIITILITNTYEPINDENTQNIIIPKAGGIGTTIFYLIGLGLMVSSVVIYAYNLKKFNKKTKGRK